MKKYLLCIGGCADGKYIEYQGDYAYFQERAKLNPIEDYNLSNYNVPIALMHLPTDKSKYQLEYLSVPGHDPIRFYHLADMELVEAITMLFNNYRPNKG